MSICGPNIKQLLAFSWKLKCSPKLQHFIWQVLSGTLSVSKNQKARGIECDLQCSICGPEEESINHVIFECPPALQTWALSRFPSPSEIFPSSSVFTSLDYLFGGFRKRLIQIVFSGSCGIYGRIEMIKFTRIRIGIPKKYCVKQKLKEHCG